MTELIVGGLKVESNVDWSQTIGNTGMVGYGVQLIKNQMPIGVVEGRLTRDGNRIKIHQARKTYILMPGEEITIDGVVWFQLPK